MVYGLNALEATKLNYEPNVNYSFCIFHKNILFICSKNAFNETIDKKTVNLLYNRYQKCLKILLSLKKHSKYDKTNYNIIICYHQLGI